MVLNTYETRKQEAFSDIFNGTCELNGFSPIKVLDDYSIEDIESLGLTGKFYFSEVENEKINFRAITFKTGDYDLGEMANMVVKALYNADLMEVTVLFDEKAKKTVESIVEDLEALDIPCKFADLKSPSDRYGFEVRIDDETVAGGYVCGTRFIEIYVYYDKVDGHFRYREDDREIDAYLVPSNKEVLSDAFVIASNLKDSGLQVEVDYSCGENQLGNSTFLIELDEKLLKSYKVKLTDRKTHEVKELSIDDLAEALLFI